MIGISDLEYLCAEVRQIARKAGAFLRDERQKFDRERVEEKSAHNYVSYVDKESERRLVEQLSRPSSICTMWLRSQIKKVNVIS